VSPRPRSRDKDDQILDAAVELFADHGVDAVGVAEIARRAGVGLGTLYLRFPSKEALATTAYAHCKRAWARAVLDDLPSEATPAEQFRAYWARLDRFAREQPRSARFLERRSAYHPHGRGDGDREGNGDGGRQDTIDQRSARMVAAWTGPGGTGLPIEVVAAIVHGTFWRVADLPVPPDRRTELLDMAREAVWRAISGGNR
jgi:AcrR family transcriptional regulator